MQNWGQERTGGTFLFSDVTLRNGSKRTSPCLSLEDGSWPVKDKAAAGGRPAQTPRPEALEGKTGLPLLPKTVPCVTTLLWTQLRTDLC